MNDMSSVIVPKSDQWNADDLIAGPRTIRIADVKISPGTEQPVSIVIEGEGKVFRPCKSMSRVLVAAWGPDAKTYVGRSATLYRDPSVKWGGMEVGGIRISHLSHIERDMIMALTATKGQRKPYTVKPLVAEVAPINDDPAAKWATAYIAKVRTETDPAALQTFIAEKAPKLAELRGKRPELASEIDLALAEVETAATESAGTAIEADTATDRTTLDAALAEIEACETHKAVNVAVALYRARHPDHADELDAAAAARIEAIGDEA